MFKAKLILLVIIVLCSYFYFSKPSDLVISVSEKGNVIGLVNKARALLQGDKFFESQLALAYDKYLASLSPKESITNKMKENEHIFKGIDEIMDNKFDGLFSTPEQRMAESLRREADRIENEGLWRSLDESIERHRLQTIEECNIIIPIINSRLIVAKQTHTPIFLAACVLILVLLILISKLRKNKRLKISTE